MYLSWSWGRGKMGSLHCPHHLIYSRLRRSIFCSRQRIMRIRITANTELLNCLHKLWSWFSNTHVPGSSNICRNLTDGGGFHNWSDCWTEPTLNTSEISKNKCTVSKMHTLIQRRYTTGSRTWTICMMTRYATDMSSAGYLHHIAYEEGYLWSVGRTMPPLLRFHCGDRLQGASLDHDLVW